MIIDEHEHAIYGTPEEIDMLRRLAANSGIAVEDLSEAFERFAICINNAVRAVSEFAEQFQELKTEQKRFRCRVCGRHYDFKGEARACERDHRQWRR